MAIPAFFLLIGVELLVQKKTGRTLYRFTDSINDLSCGVINQVISVFTAAALFGLYVFTFNHAAVFELPSASPWTWALGLVGVDFGYYWFHRTAHRRNLVWATHVVHHQSEEYNLTVALRQGAIEPWATWIFYQPLALLGVPPLVFITLSSVNTIYQFWVHTRAITRLGPLELVFNTPSHHRVHHGADPKYLDRNFGGMFIVWDRLFGTFQIEEEEPTYGLVAPLASWNPVWANLKFPVELFVATKGWPLAERLAVCWEGPTATAQRMGKPPVEVAGREKYDAPSTPSLRGYVFAQFVLVVAALLALLLAASSMSGGQQASLGAFVVVSLWLFGGLFEGRDWARRAERLRLIAWPLLGAGAFGLAGALGGLVVAGASAVRLAGASERG
jgi:alkylglycerol monooxygenase